MNIDEIIKLAHNVKPPSKTMAFSMLRDLIKDIGPEHSEKLVHLYSYFVPKFKVPKNEKQWLAVARGQSDVRFYLNYIYSDGERMIATNGHRAHVVFHKNDPGFYSDEWVKVQDQNFSTFPDVNKVTPSIKDNPITLNAGDLKQCEIIKLDRVFAYHLHGKTYVKKQYIDQAVSMLPDAKIHIRDEISTILVRSDETKNYAVVMPIIT